MKNNKGFTVVELIVTFLLVMTFTLGLFKMVDAYRTKQQKELYRKETMSFRDQILRIVQDDMDKYKVEDIEGLVLLGSNPDPDCNGFSQGILIKYKNNNNNKKLCIDNNGFKIKYDNKEYAYPNNFTSVEEGFIFQRKNLGETTVDNVSYNNTLYSVSFKIKNEEINESFDFKAVDIKHERIN